MGGNPVTQDTIYICPQNQGWVLFLVMVTNRMTTVNRCGDAGGQLPCQLSKGDVKIRGAQHGNCAGGRGRGYINPLSGSSLPPAKIQIKHTEIHRLIILSCSSTKLTQSILNSRVILHNYCKTITIDDTQYILILTLPMLRLLSSKAQGHTYFGNTI